jgi:hypothetical protein
VVAANALLAASFLLTELQIGATVAPQAAREATGTIASPVALVLLFGGAGRCCSASRCSRSTRC